MPVIFAHITDGVTAQKQGSSVPPVPEHPSEKLECAQVGEFTAGIWRHPSIAREDCVFVSQEAGHEIACVCDGEISNRKDLAERLSQLGVRPGSNGIAELVGKLVSALGEKAFNQIRGVFRCIVYSKGYLWMACDRFGGKRLAYSANDAELWVCSRPEWLGRAAKRDISPESVYQFLNFSFVPTPHTIFDRTDKLPVGHFGRWNRGALQVRPYWQMCYAEQLQWSESEIAADLRTRIGNAVGNTTDDLPRSATGCYLSGGTDSSTVMGMAAAQWKQAPPSYSIGFAEEEFSELYYSRIATRHFGSQANEFIVTAEDAWNELPRIVRAFGEPFGNPSAVGGYFCARAASRNDVAVMLAGDGGDEIFGGNERYRKDKIYNLVSMVPRFVTDGAVSNWLWQAASGSSSALRLRNILRRASMRNPERFYVEDALLPYSNGDFFSRSLLAHAKPPLALVKRYFEEVEARSELNRLLYIDLKLTIADNDLIKVGQTAAACGVRVRYPLLDHELVEYSGEIPAALKVKGLKKRYIFKLALRDFLPDEIIHKKKHGFGVPVSLWFRSHKGFRELLLDVTSDRTTTNRGYLNAAGVRKIVDEHLKGVVDHGQTLWAILMLELWQRGLEQR